APPHPRRQSFRLPPAARRARLPLYIPRGVSVSGRELRRSRCYDERVKRLYAVAFGLASVGCLYAFQKPFREYYSEEGYNDFPKPPDYRDQTDFVFARMMYPQGNWGIFGRLWRYNYKEGNSAWTNDYPRSDRHFVLALRRLTRLEVRSVEQPVSPDDADDIYNWPFLYCVGPDQWNMSEAQLAKVRDYLARGGFLL